MKVFGLWYGGSSYELGDIEHDLEAFQSLKAASAALADRRSFGYSYAQSFDYVGREPERSYCPVVGNDSELWIWFTDPRERADPYPDRIVKFGPRLGVLIERT